MPRSPFNQPRETTRLADSLRFDTQTENDIWSLGFHQQTEDDINALGNLLKMPDPLPVVVSPQPSVEQVRQQQEAARPLPVAAPQPAPAAMPEQASQQANTQPDVTYGDGRTDPPVPATREQVAGATVVDGRRPAQGATQADSGVAAQIAAGPGKAARYAAQIAQVAREEGVPPDVLAGLIDTESSGEDSVSPAGARGIMQVVPGQKDWQGRPYTLPDENPADPLTSIRQGARAVRDKHHYTGSWEAAGRAYFGYGTDAGGMTTDRYGRIYDANRARYQQGPGAASLNAGAAPPPAPATPPAAPAAATPPPPVAGGGGDLVTIRSNTGGTLQVPRSSVGEGPGQYSSDPKRGGYTIVGGAPAAQTPLSDTAGSSPAAQDAYRVPLGGGEPWTQRTADSSSTATRPIGKASGTAGFSAITMDRSLSDGGSDTSDLMLRNPLLPTDPEATTGAPFDPRDADSGPRESGYTDPGYEPGGSGVASEVMAPTTPSSYGAAGDEPQVPDTRPDISYSTGGPPIGTPSGPTVEMETRPLSARQEPQVVEQGMPGLPTLPGFPDATPLIGAGGKVLAWLHDQASSLADPLAPIREGYARAGENVASGLTPGGQEWGAAVRNSVGRLPEAAAEAGRRTVEGIYQGTGYSAQVRLGEIGRQAARDQGREGDIVAIMRAPDDPAWRAQNPELAAEYDDLQSQLGLIVGGQIGTVTGVDAQAMVRPRVIPPDVADTLDFPVRIPEDPAVIRAIEVAGGSVDPERGVTLGVTRAQSPAGAGKTATRGGVFYEAVPEGGRSSFVGADDPTRVGGSEVIPRTETRYRSPMILSDAPGTDSGFDTAMEQMGLATRVERRPGDPLWMANAWEPGSITAGVVDRSIHAARQAGPPGSPARAQAIKDLVTRYGGDPNLVDEAVALRGESSESTWAIKENILAHNARAKGYDGVLTVQGGMSPSEYQDALESAVKAHPQYQAQLDAINAIKVEQERAVQEYAALYDRLRGSVPSERFEAYQAQIDGFLERSNAAQRKLENIHDRLIDTVEVENPSKITELADFREGANPTPGAPNPRIAELQAEIKAARDRWFDVKDADSTLPREPGESVRAWQRRMDIDKLEQEKAALRELHLLEGELKGVSRNEPTAGPPGFSLRPDIKRRGGETDVRSTLGVSRGTGLAADVGSSLGSGTMGAAVGAGLPADSDEERRNNALTGAAVGMVAGPMASRAMRRGGGGALATFGVTPGGNANRAAQSPNPHIRNLARQMQGNYRPTGVAERPLAERIVAALTDKNAIVGNVEREIKERITAAGTTPPLTRLAERVRANPNSIAAQRAREELAPALQKVGDDADWAEQYMVHRHNLDVARAKGQEAYDEAIARGRTPQQAQAIADRVRTSRLFSGGMTEQDIIQALSDIPAEIGPSRFKTVVDTAQAHWDTWRKSLDEKLAEGMISPAVHQELTTRYPHYVRTDIADYFERGPAMPSPGGKTMGVSNVGIKAIDRVGTTKDRVNPVLSTIDGLYAHEASMVRNAAAKDLVALRDAEPTTRALFKEVAPDVKAYRANRADMVPPEYSLKGSEQKLTQWENGVARQFVIPGEYAQLLTPRQGALLGDSAVAQGTRNFFGLWKAAITTHNPGFQFVVSPVRDLGDYAVGEATRTATRNGPVGAAQAIGAVPGVLADYVRALPAAFEGLGKNQFSSEVADLRRAGAGFEGRPARTDQGLRSAYRDLQRSGGMAIRSPEDALRAARTLLTLGAEPIGSRFELVPRIAAARRAAGRGADPLGQAMAFKDATIDFLKGGWLTQQLNVPVPFLNPTVQSAAQVGRLAKKNPAAFAAAVGAGIGVPAMLADAWNRSDEQRARDLEDVPDSIKNGGIVWMLPGVEGSTELGERKPNYLWVPLGSFAFAARLAREGLGLADPLTGLTPSQPKPGREVNSVGDAAMRAAELGGEIMAMFSPVKGENLSSSVASLVPPVASEAIEIGIDKDLYRGNQIATDRRDENASNLSKGAAAALNYVGNTDQVRSSQVEHVVRGVGGYAGQLATAASDLGRNRGEQRPVQDVPVLGGLASRVIRDTGGQQLEDARDPAVRVPDGVRDVLAEAGMRSDQLTAVPNRYRGAPLTREEQERWQSLTNSLITREVTAVRRSSEWRERGANKERLVSEAVSTAKQAAAERALRRLTDREIERRTQQEERRRAS